MDKIVDDLRTLGATDIHKVEFDAAAVDTHRELINNAQQLAGEITCAIVAFGILGEQDRAEHDEHHAVDIATVDYLAQVSMLTVLSDVMSRGHIVAFSSIAGWRARRANYVYGSTKAGLERVFRGLVDNITLDQRRVLAAIPACHD